MSDDDQITGVMTTQKEGYPFRHSHYDVEAGDEEYAAAALPAAARGLMYLLMRSYQAQGVDPGSVHISEPDDPHPSVCVKLGGITREYRWFRKDVSRTAMTVMADHLLWMTLMDLGLFPEEYNHQEFA